jgi:uncharacterized protein (DUF1778 family)
MAKGRQQINLRIDSRDRELFDEAADAQDESLTQFLLESGRERAERLLADRSTFALDSAQWRQLMDRLDESPRVNPGIVDLFRRPGRSRPA